MTAEPKVSLGGIGKLELFDSLPAKALEDARTAMRAERVAKGALIFEQGDPVDRAYALAAGSVRVVQTGRDGGQAIVRFVAPGEMFGVLPLFTDHRFPADAIATESSIVLSWSERHLSELIARYPLIALNVIGVLGGRMAQLQERVRELTTQRAEQRVARTVLRLAAQAGRDGPRGTTIELPLRRKDFAQFAGTTLHTASRLLAAWEKAGWIAGDGQRLTIRDRAAIHRLAEGDGCG